MKDPILDFYRQPGPRTGIGATHIDLFPEDIPGIVARVRSLLIHHLRVERENIPVSAEKLKVWDPLTAEDVFSEIDLSAAAAGKLPLHERAVGICRNFAMVTAAVLRSRGIPARTRCGFGTYFGKGLEDHWVCEYWEDGEEGWKKIDAQMDSYWRAHLRLDPSEFDDLDVKDSQFLAGGEVWRMYRRNLVSGGACGFHPERDTGEYYIRGNMLRDLFALNKMEYIYQERSRLMEKGVELNDDDLELLDSVAVLTGDPDGRFEELRSFCEGHPELQPNP